MRNRGSRLGVAVFLVVAACTPEPLPCNGALHLCERRFDEVTFATAHNAMSCEDERWEPANQGPCLEQQLADGVRGFMLDVYDYDGQVQLCHGVCGLGHKPMVEELGVIRDFLDANPREIAAILFETYVTAEEIAATFDAANLKRLVHTQAAGQAWPTLQQLIDAGHRLVVFTETGGGSPGWLHPLYELAWDSPYHAENKADLTCTGGRGEKGRGLFLVNHFVSNPFASRENAQSVNFNPFLLERVRDCEAENGHRANFVAVDFYDEGDLLSVVATLNER